MGLPKVDLECDWLPFRGASLLFDNPAGNLTAASDLPVSMRLMNVSGESCPSLYRRLHASAIDSVQGDSTAVSGLCVLPISSFHVTYLDGFNDDNVREMNARDARDVQDFLDGLPDALADEIAARMQESCAVDAFAVTFGFDELALWENALVAKLKPRDESHEAFGSLVKRRRAIETAWKQLGRPQSRYFYQPHITLGYTASSWEPRSVDSIATWNDGLRQQLENVYIAFSSVSLYGFSNMITFFK